MLMQEEGGTKQRARGTSGAGVFCVKRERRKTQRRGVGVVEARQAQFRQDCAGWQSRPTTPRPGSEAMEKLAVVAWQFYWRRGRCQGAPTAVQKWA